MSLKASAGFTVLRRAFDMTALAVRWWTSELHDLWEAAATHLNLRRARVGRIHLTATELQPQIIPILASDPPISALPRPPNDAALGSAIASWVQSVQPLKRVEVVLPATAVLHREVRLPMAVKRETRSAMAFQIERLMPLKKEQVYFDCPIVRFDSARNEVVVDLAITRRTLVDTILDEASASVSSKIVILAERSSTDALVAGAPYFHFGDRQQLTQLQSRRMQRVLWAAVAAMAVIVLGTVLVQDVRLDRQLSAQLAQFAQASDKATQLKSQLEQRLSRIRFLIAQTSQSDAAEVLSAVTAQLPDDAWVFQFQLEGRQVRITGIAKDTAAVVAALSRSPIFDDVALQSANKSNDPSTERFDILLRVRPPAP